MSEHIQLETMIERALIASEVPAFAIGILQNNNLVYSKGFGKIASKDVQLFLNSESNEFVFKRHESEVTPSNLFGIASVTKSLTGTAVMILVDQNLVELDQKVSTYIPEFKTNNENSKYITVRMLLNHSSGLPEQAPLVKKKYPDTLAEYIRENVSQCNLKFNPGKEVLYSNTGINLAGHILEKVCNSSFEKIMKQLIFNPLNMLATDYLPSCLNSHLIVPPYKILENGQLQFRPWHIYRAEYPSEFLISSIFDLSNFAQLHLNGGYYNKQQILSQNAISEMHLLQTFVSKISNSGYGLAFRVDEFKGRRRVRQLGFDNGYGCIVELYPNENSGIIMMTNCEERFRYNANRIHSYIVNHILKI